MKKLSTYLFLILFSFQTSSWADDISDFEIEGMSIGDSLLDYMSETKINALKEPFNDGYIVSHEFYSVSIQGVKLKTYDEVHFYFKPDDKKFYAHSISGYIDFKNINDCYTKQDEILEELTIHFGNIADKVGGQIRTHPGDKSGKSTIKSTTFYLHDGGGAHVGCYNFSKELGGSKHLTLELGSAKYAEFQMKN